MTFDYEADTPADAVLSVADSIRSSCRLPPLTEKQKEQRRVEIEDHQELERWRAEDRRAERERQQAETEAIARQEAAAEIAEHNRLRRLQQQREYMERAEHRSRSLDLSALKFEAQSQAAWRAAVQQDLRAQYRNSLVGELDAMIAAQNAQPAEPQEVNAVDQLGSPNFFDDDYNPNYYADKFAGKFKR